LFLFVNKASEPQVDVNLNASLAVAKHGLDARPDRRASLEINASSAGMLVDQVTGGGTTLDEWQVPQANQLAT